MNICKRSWTKESVNNQKVQKFVAVLDENLSIKNTSNFSAKYFEDKIFKIKIIQNISVILRTFGTLICIKLVPRDPSTIFLATIFAQKMPVSSGFMYSSILMPGNIYDIIILPKVDQIHKKLWICSNLVWVPGNPQLQ